MDKKNTIALSAGVVVLIIALVAFYFMTSPQAEIAVPAGTSAFGTDNPLEKKPDLNPVSKTNPYANIKTNPFE